MVEWPITLVWNIVPVRRILLLCDISSRLESEEAAGARSDLKLTFEIIVSLKWFYFLCLPLPCSPHCPQESMESLHRRLERSRQMQTVLRAFEARDRNLLEDNLWRVSFWSCASVLVMLCVALTQVNGELAHHTAQYGNSAAKRVWLSCFRGFYSLSHCLLSVLILSQVYTVRKLFDDKRRVCT